MPTETIARHGELRPPRPWRSALLFVIAAVAVLLVAGAAVAAVVVAQLSSEIDTFVLPGQEDDPPAIAALEGGFNVLIVGSDVCEDDSGCNGRGTNELNDFTMLLHVSEDQTNAVGVSFPRDLVVPIPPCPTTDGSGTHPAFPARPINETLALGGQPCTALTVTALTGLEIQYAGLIKFSGVIAMSNAVGGVPVCVSGPIRDPGAGLEIPAAGTYTLAGEQALAFLRTRHGIGDGGDLTRISSQQVFLSSLLRTIKSNDTLGDPVKVYNLARAATSSMTLSENFAQLDTLASIALALRDIPLERFTFVQYPAADATAEFAGKVVPAPAEAEALFAKIRADEPFALPAAGDGRGSAPDPNAPAPTPAPPAPATPTPGTAAPPAPTPPIEVLNLRGQTAADSTCSIPN